MRIIGLVGAKGAGKTTAYNFIKEKLPFAQEITLAKKLKDTCSEIFDIPRNYFDSHTFKEKYLEVPAYLDKLALERLFKGFNTEIVDFDRQIRPHIGVILDSPRKIAQYIGTEVLRTISPDIHCTSAMADFTRTNSNLGVVTDMRFPNEFQYFKENSEIFVPIYVKNTGAENEASKDTHASEAHLKTLATQSLMVANDNTLENFRRLLYNTLKEMGVL